MTYLKPIPRTAQDLGREIYQFLASLAKKGAAVADVSTADASAAPVAYDQTQIQELVDLTKDNKDQLNALLAALRTKGVIET